MKFCPLCKSDLIKKEVNEAERLVCSSETCDYIFWDNPTPVVGAIIEHENEIILANNVSWPENWYSIITGFLEKDETPETGIKREVKEETNLDVQSINFVGNYSFFKFNQLIIVYHVHATGEIRLNEELRAYKRIKKDKLRPWDSETGHAVRDWLKQAGYTDKQDLPFKRLK